MTVQEQLLSLLNIVLREHDWLHTSSCNRVGGLHLIMWNLSGFSRFSAIL